MTSANTLRRTRGVVWTLRSGAIARIGTLPITLAVALLTTHLLIERLGTTQYAIYGACVGLVAVLAALDLGMGAAVTNAVSTFRASAVSGNALQASAELRMTLRYVQRTLAFVSATVLLVAFGMLTLVGSPNADVSVSWIAVALVLFAASLLLSTGPRVILGLDRPVLLAMIAPIQAVSTVFAVVVIALLSPQMGRQGAVVAVPSASLAVTNAIFYMLAKRRLSEQGYHPESVAPSSRSVIWATALPMSVIAVANSAMTQLDRTILGARVGIEPTAEYVLATQLFSPLASLISLMGITLWPKFAASRANGDYLSPLPLSKTYGGFAALGCLTLSLAANPVAHFVSGGKVTLSWATLVAVSLAYIVQAMQWPLGMYFTDSSGLKIQALLITLTLAANLTLTWMLSRTIGAAGPALATASSIGAIQILPEIWLFRRRQPRKADAYVSA